MPTGLTRSLCPTGIALVALLASTRVGAHELGVDELRLWVPPQGHELRGQLTFDPELTRSLDADLADAVKRERITDFVAQQLSFEVNGRPCTPALAVRELYERGGATPGDVVMLGCPLSPSAPLVVKLTLGSGFPALVVQGVGMTLDPVPALTTLAAGSSVTFRREPGAALTEPPTAYGRLALGFFRRGVEHVVPSGVDHLLFVTAITLGTSRTPRRLFALLTLFTLAHTAAVAWVAKGLSAPPAALVEPCIAASAAVAGWAAHRRLEAWRAAPLVVLFGLIHGLGFAGGLARLETALPAFLASVVAFNLGVEAAQAVAVLVVWSLLYVASRRSLPVERLTSGCALAITAVGVAWTVLRLLS